MALQYLWVDFQQRTVARRKGKTDSGDRSRGAEVLNVVDLSIF